MREADIQTNEYFSILFVIPANHWLVLFLQTASLSETAFTLLMPQTLHDSTQLLILPQKSVKIIEPLANSYIFIDRRKSIPLFGFSNKASVKTDRVFNHHTLTSPSK